MKRFLPRNLMACLLFITPAGYGYELEVRQLKCDFLEDPLGLENSRPGLSWEIHADRRDVRQAAYEVLVASSPDLLDADNADCWSTGLVESDQSVQVAYGGKALASASRYYWKVRVRDQSGVNSPWSETAFFETGLLSAVDWQAEWIWAPDLEKAACPWFRKTFELETLPAHATAFVGSAGYHELYINGRKASDDVLAPSVSDLRKRALYRAYDISPFLTEGKNVVAFWLAPGWTQFREFNPPADFGREGKPLVIAQVHFDGQREILTDSTWRCSASDTWHLGKWQNSDFGGDSVNAYRSEPGWNRAAYDDSQWAQAAILDPGLILSSDYIEANRMVKQIPAKAITRVAPGKYHVAMDKLYTGWIEVSMEGNPGTAVIIKASAHSDTEVEFNQRNVYVIGPEGKGTFRNRFSYHEVGYVSIEGPGQAPGMQDVRGYQVSNDRDVVGGFDCSDTLLKQIYDITCYNYENLSTGGMSVDCPHRERLGYGGDGHGSLEIALDSYASHPFFTRWAQDWVDIQDENGRINHTAPTLGGGGGPAWSGFIVTMPWEVYLSYGDTGILERVFPAAVRWLDYLDRHVGEGGLLGIPSPGHWEYAGGTRWLFLGDWATPHGNEESDTPEAALFNNCYYVYVLGLAAKMAEILDQPGLAHGYREQAGRIKQAINKRFFDPKTHAYIDTRQTHCVMPLLAGVVPPEHIQAVMENLEREILVSRDGHFDTGIHGTYYLVKYLTENNRSDLVHTLASQTSFPSYGYFIDQGYVTWPEYWHECNSLMHGCLNGIGGWFIRGVAGIRPDPGSPGYRHAIIKPAQAGDLAWARGHHDSPYGRIACNWKKNKGLLEMDLTIPPNTSATVYVPAADASLVNEGGIPAAGAMGVTLLRQENGQAVFRLGSGEYHFTIHAGGTAGGKDYVIAVPVHGKLAMRAAVRLQSYMGKTMGQSPGIEPMPVLTNKPELATVIVIGTDSSFVNLDDFGMSDDLEKISGEGYLLRSLSSHGKKYIFAVGKTERGASNAVWHLMKKCTVIKGRLSVPSLNLVRNPLIRSREVVFCAPWAREGDKGLGEMDQALYAKYQPQCWDTDRLTRYVNLLDGFGYDAIELSDTWFFRDYFENLGHEPDQWTKKIIAMAEEAHKNGQTYTHFLYGSSVKDYVKDKGYTRPGACFNDPYEKQVLLTEYDYHASRYGPFADRLITHWSDWGGQPGCEKCTIETALRQHNILAEKFKAGNPDLTSALSLWQINPDLWPGYENDNSILDAGILSREDVAIAIDVGSGTFAVNAPDPPWKSPVPRCRNIMDKGYRPAVWMWRTLDIEHWHGMHVHTGLLERYFRSIPPDIAGALAFHSVDNVSQFLTLSNQYVAGQLMWDPDQSGRELLREFTGLMFGAVNAEAMATVYEAIEMGGCCFCPGWQPGLAEALEGAEQRLTILRDARARLDKVKIPPDFVSVFPVIIEPGALLREIDAQLFAMIKYAEFHVEAKKLLAKYPHPLDSEGRQGIIGDLEALPKVPVPDRYLWVHIHSRYMIDYEALTRLVFKLI